MRSDAPDVKSGYDWAAVLVRWVSVGKELEKYA